MAAIPQQLSTFTLIEAGLLLGLGLLAVVLLARRSRRVEQALTRVALGLFRRSLEVEGRTRAERERLLQSVHATVTYPVYASRTLLYSAIVGVAGGLVGVYLLKVLVAVVVATDGPTAGRVPAPLAAVLTADVASISTLELFVLMLASSATVGALGAGLTYTLRWRVLASRARRRRVLIDESVARTIAFVYALGRTGMVFPEVMRTVARNRQAFGESAEEVSVVVKDMNLFGADLASALERIARRTPSEKFADFAENFANVLESGQNVKAYLREQYEQYQSERVANQEQLLELLAALGEGYVAGLVAGPLFLLTVLLIVGLLTGGMLDVLQVIVYLLIPLANLGFIAYLGSVATPLSAFHAPIDHRVDRPSISVRRVGDPGTHERAADGGASLPHETNRRRLRAYNRTKHLKRALLQPIRTVTARPTTLFYLTVPIAIVGLVVGWWPILRGTAVVEPRAVDDHLVWAFVFVVGSFAVVREVHTRRLRAIERAVPDLLERLASTNEAGMTFTESLQRVDRSDLGALNVEVERLLNDIRWGGRTEDALYRFSNRVTSSTVARIVALLANAMSASGNLGPVVRIAADEAREARRLRAARYQEMFLYTVVIYLAFVVFLGIGLALKVILIPSIPAADALGQFGNGSPAALAVQFPISPAGTEARAYYELLIAHVALVQAAVMGFVAGQMGRGSVQDGAKHATLMVVIAYVVFLLIG